MRKRTGEPVIKMVETGLVRLNINVPGLVPENVKSIVRDVRRTLENCARIKLLDEFTETGIVEYTEILGEEVN